MTVSKDAIAAALASADYGDRLKAVNDLRQLEPAEAFELILLVLNDSHVRVRYAAISQMDTLGHVNPALTLEYLRHSLAHEAEIDVKAAAADAIGALKLTEAFEELKAVYEQSNDWLLQMSIISCLGELGDPRGYELLLRALESPEALIQLAAITSLGELGNPDAIPVLAQYLNHEDWQMRQRVVQAFSHLGGPTVIPYLQTLSRDAMPQVAEFAESCLKSMQ
jgi:HEAT repeat protein